MPRAITRAISEPAKKIVAARQRWCCSECKSILPATFQVDHTVALCDGGADSIDNCTAMCPNCHAAKTQRECILRHSKKQAAAFTYGERVDICVTPTTLVCTQCRHTRPSYVAHTYCIGLEQPDAVRTGLHRAFQQFKFKPRVQPACTDVSMQFNTGLK